jgi:hypothetical protein
MNKKILVIAITYFSCLLLITSFAVADKLEWTGKSGWVEKKQAEGEAKKSDCKANREAKKSVKRIKLKRIRIRTVVR